MSKIFKITLPVIVAGVLMCLFTASIYAAKQVKPPAVTIPVQITAYLTPFSVDGANVLGACEVGYHVANAYELQALSPFIYNTTLGGRSSAYDAGEGPFHGTSGWVRSGMTNLSPIGEEWNCLGWTSNDGLYEGTVVSFDFVELFNGGNAAKFSKAQCDNLKYVWCISDAVY